MWFVGLMVGCGGGGGGTIPKAIEILDAPGPAHVTAIAADGSEGYVVYWPSDTDSATLRVGVFPLEPGATVSELATIPRGGFATDVEVHPVTGSLYVAVDERVFVVTTGGTVTEDTITASGLGFHPDGSALYTGSYNSGVAGYTMDGDTRGEALTLPATTGTDCAHDGERLWVLPITPEGGGYVTADGTLFGLDAYEDDLTTFATSIATDTGVRFFGDEALIGGYDGLYVTGITGIAAIDRGDGAMVADTGNRPAWSAGPNMTPESRAISPDGRVVAAVAEARLTLAGVSDDLGADGLVGDWCRVAGQPNEYGNPTPHRLTLGDDGAAPYEDATYSSRTWEAQGDTLRLTYEGDSISITNESLFAVTSTALAVIEDHDDNGTPGVTGLYAHCAY